MKAWNKYSMSGWPIMIALLLLIVCSQITIASYRNTCAMYKKTCRAWEATNKRQVERIERLSTWQSKLEDQDHNCMDGITKLLPAGDVMNSDAPKAVDIIVPAKTNMPPGFLLQKSQEGKYRPIRERSGDPLLGSTQGMKTRRDAIAKAWYQYDYEHRDTTTGWEDVR